MVSVALRRKWRRIFLGGGCIAAFAASSNAVHAQASAYVPLDDIAYTYVDALMARGYLGELSALERPFTERALVTAIDSARTRDPSAVIASYLDAAYASIEKYAVRPGNTDSTAAQTFRARGTADLYATAQTSGRRELMLADSATSVRPGGSIRVVMAGGPVVGFVRTLIDTRLNADPEFAGRKDRKLAGRTEDGYVSGQGAFGELAFGRLGRNWGPPSLYGLTLGNYAYSYDQLYGRIGTDRFHFATVVARLDDLAPNTGPAIQRYFSIHRLAARFSRWEIAATESYVYSGAGRGFEPALVNPLNIYALTWRNEQKEGNLNVAGELSFRSGQWGTFAAQLMVDDYQIDKSCDPYCKQPASYGLTLTGEGLRLWGEQRAFASYTRVSNLTYNNKIAGDHYEIFGVGLGRGFNDYDEVRAGIDLAVVPSTPLRAYVALRRQGEGSYNLPFPAPNAFATTPGIFSGVVMGVARLGVSGATRWRDFEVGGDLGVNHVRNAEHIVGATRNSFEGRVKVAVEPRWSVNF